MNGIRFTEYVPNINTGAGFSNLLKIFMHLLTITSGDIAEAFNWMNQMDKKYDLTNQQYGMGDFIQELKDKNYIEENENGSILTLTSKGEQSIRRQSLEEIFGKLKKSSRGNHITSYSGLGDEATSDRREYYFGDSVEQIDITGSIKNAQVNHGIRGFEINRR